MGTATSRKITGTVKWFNDAKGFGFIERDDKEKDVFVHYTGVAAPKQGRAWRSLAEGDKVEFEIVNGTNMKPQAVNVVKLVN